MHAAGRDTRAPLAAVDLVDRVDPLPLRRVHEVFEREPAASGLRVIVRLPCVHRRHVLGVIRLNRVVCFAPSESAPPTLHGPTPGTLDPWHAWKPTIADLISFPPNHHRPTVAANEMRLTPVRRCPAL